MFNVCTNLIFQVNIMPNQLMYLLLWENNKYHAQPAVHLFDKIVKSREIQLKMWEMLVDLTLALHFYKSKLNALQMHENTNSLFMVANVIRLTS